MHQVILYIRVTKDLDKKVFDNIYLLGETLSFISWVIRASYRCTIMATPGVSVFGRDMIFNLAAVVYLQVITAEK